MEDHDDFAFEPIPGLPEALPEGEEILWQGRPSTLALAQQSLWFNWVVGYFVLLVIWRVGVSSTQFPLVEALGHGVPFLVLGMICAGVILAIAWLQARGAMYTLTTHRVAMRIGAALQMTLNLPYQWIENASLDLRKSGVGTIALELKGDSHVSYMTAWPHIRPWKMAKPQPALRCIPDAEKVAKILAEAAETRIADASSIKVGPAPQPEGSDTGTAVPAE
ncbi:photosynthetic complex putative assembly protein PuhB [Shimia ponticola]|uniref:photosynthetic complex putative assembly protein PuhB n=1 Tax=Shimia ponticola TaxID=2582893 RepID=UPI0011BF3130|nr:photosynthetic complex putative assembly protein PuhB [Shimia ponticola]